MASAAEYNSQQSQRIRRITKNSVTACNYGLLDYLLLHANILRILTTYVENRHSKCKVNMFLMAGNCISFSATSLHFYLS